MKTIKFRQLPRTDIEGNIQPKDVAAPIGNTLFNLADDVDEHDLGIKIYHEGDAGTEIDEKEAAILTKYLPCFKYNLREAIRRSLEDK